MFPHLKEEYVSRKNFRYGKNVQVGTTETKRLKYLASIACMDEAIGEVLDLLDQYKIADNTIVIFFSDNGGGGGSDNSPLKGGKAWMFEGGIRVPCIVRYPRAIPAGTVSHEFLTALEITPTLWKLAGVETPKNLMLDGNNSDRSVPCRELIVQMAPRQRQYFIYTYKCGESYTNSFWNQQFTIFANGLLNRNSSGALIRVSTRVTTTVDDARKRAMQLLRKSIPYLDENLK